MAQGLHNGYVCCFVDYNSDGWPDILTTSLAPWESTVEGLRARGHVLHVDGVTPFSVDDLPAARAQRGEQFDDFEFIARPKRGNVQVHLVVSGRPLKDADGAIYGAALVYHDITASRETDRLGAALIRLHPELELTKVVDSDVGASVYSASAFGSQQ